MNDPLPLQDDDDVPYHTPLTGHSPGVPETLDHLRKKMEGVATDFAAGKMNRAQFNAIYAHYNEQRILVEKLHQRNPDNDLWRQAALPGHTGFLRSHFESRMLFYIVFRHRDPRPLIKAGEEPSKETGRQIGAIIKTVWQMDQLPPTGVARKAIGNGQWIVMAMGEFALTVAIYSLQPSQQQYTLVRDLHNDFERANRLILQRNLSANKMVFPQRALLS